MRDIVDFFRRYPQALALLIICIVLGVGTFIAVLVSLAASPNHTGPGYPTGVVAGFQAVVSVLGR